MTSRELPAWPFEPTTLEDPGCDSAQGEHVWRLPALSDGVTVIDGVRYTRFICKRCGCHRINTSCDWSAAGRKWHGVPMRQVYVEQLSEREVLLSADGSALAMFGAGQPVHQVASTLWRQPLYASIRASRTRVAEDE
jgi:hypothetical protein